jgi:hypothetical protein
MAICAGSSVAFASETGLPQEMKGPSMCLIPGSYATLEGL